MKPGIKRSVFLAGLIALSACGGSNGTPDCTDCPPPIDPGTPPPPPPPPAGDQRGLLSDYSGPWAWDAAGGDGGTGGGGDGGGIGAGGADGRIAQAEVTVTLDDGTVLGPASTSNKGLFTIRAGDDYRGGINIDLVGVPGTTYFDEAKEADLPFPAGDRLRAQTDLIRSNIGVTPLTEAAVRLQSEPAFAQLPPAERIKLANDTVLAQINSQLPDKYKLTDITRLPALVAPQSLTAKNQINTLSRTTLEGKYGAILAGLSIAASRFNPTLQSPGFDIGRQLVKDLADGRLDGTGPGGEPIASDNKLAYSMDELSGQLTAAIETANTRFGAVDEPEPTPTSVSRGEYQGAGGFDDLKEAVLGSNGVVVAGGTEVLALPGSTVPATTLFSDGATMFIRRADGSMEAVGLNFSSANDLFHRFGVASPSSTEQPVRAAEVLSGPEGATQISLSPTHALARTVTGEVWAWGTNFSGQLGVDDIETAFEPVRVTVVGAEIKSVGAGIRYSIALTTEGRVLSWGDGAGGVNTPDDANPGPLVRVIEVQQADPAGSLSGVTSIVAAYFGAFAVKADGTVWAWGSDQAFSLDDVEAARPVAGLSNIRKLSRVQSGLIALDGEGEVWYWGASSPDSESGAIAPTKVPGFGVKIRDIQGRGVTRAFAVGVGGEEFEVVAPGRIANGEPGPGLPDGPGIPPPTPFVPVN